MSSAAERVEQLRERCDVVFKEAQGTMEQVFASKTTIVCEHREKIKAVFPSFGEPQISVKNKMSSLQEWLDDNQPHMTVCIKHPLGDCDFSFHQWDEVSSALGNLHSYAETLIGCLKPEHAVPALETILEGLTDVHGLFDAPMKLLLQGGEPSEKVSDETEDALALVCAAQKKLEQNSPHTRILCFTSKKNGIWVDSQRQWIFPYRLNHTWVNIRIAINAEHYVVRVNSMFDGGLKVFEVPRHDAHEIRINTSERLIHILLRSFLKPIKASCLNEDSDRVIICLHERGHMIVGE
jgi:hypothetical protein